MAGTADGRSALGDDILLEPTSTGHRKHYVRSERWGFVVPRALLAPAVTDVDGNGEDRSDTVSVFNGPPPAVRSWVHLPVSGC